MNSVDVQVVDDTGRVAVDRAQWIAVQARKAVMALGVPGEVRVKIVDDAAMSAAHLEFSEVEGTTDVLTFDLTDPEDPHPDPPSLAPRGSNFVRSSYALDTDILICLDEGLRHSAPGGYPVERELLLYVVHGVLHCLGMDDHDEADAATMHQMEDAVLETIGVGAVYGARNGALPGGAGGVPGAGTGD